MLTASLVRTLGGIPAAELRRVLVIKLRHHGDVLLASPVFSALQSYAPQAEIDALVYADTAAMLSGHPAIAELHAIDRNWKRLGLGRQIAAEGRLIARLRRRRYDLLVHLSDHQRGAWLARLLRPRVAVAPRLPQKSRFWRASFTHSYPKPAHTWRHTVEQNLDALRRIGIQPQAADRRLVLRPGDAAATRVDALLDERGLAGEKFIVIHPASRWLFKCWPAEQNAALVDALAAQGWKLVLTAAPDREEKALVATILEKAAAAAVDLSGQLSLPELAALIGRARLFIGVDSAPMHIAAAVGTPTVAIFGPSGDPEWGPWQVAHRIVASDVHPCRPCGLDGCGGGKVAECLTTLPVTKVLAAAAELLAPGA